jgi:hypothetical protein
MEILVDEYPEQEKRASCAEPSPSARVDIIVRESVTKCDEGGPKGAEARLLLTTTASRDLKSSKYTDLLELNVFALGNRRWHMYLD